MEDRLFSFETTSFTVSMAAQPTELSLCETENSGSVAVYEFFCRFDAPTPVQNIRICWSRPMLGILSVWAPMLLRERAVHQWWAPTRSESSFYKGAPVIAAVRDGSHSVCTVALSDSITPCSLSFAVNDFAQLEQVDYCAELLCEERTVTEYRVLLRIDEQGLPLGESLRGVADWWSTFYARKLPVNPVCELPLYSSWYNFHQHPNAQLLEKELELAAALGFKAAIIDDGWQYEGNGTGDYFDCGNWAVASGKFPDFAAFIRKAHVFGIKVMLWFPVPFVGQNTQAYRTFRDRFLYFDQGSRAGVLDPRRPEVRRYLVDLFRDFLLQYDLDGLKLDFIDSFRATKETPPFDAATMDCPTVDGSVERLLKELTAALRSVKDDCMIEFRQHYISPAITAHCNMLRVLDCAFDSLTNRLCIADLRMLTNTLAVHSDMLFWAQNETPVNCARQLLNILFAVPQISILLTKATAEQRQVIQNYLAYWNANRELLLHAPLTVTGMDGNYSTLSACDGSKRITALYLDPTAVFDGMPLDVFNGTAKDWLYLENTADCTICATVYDCFGTMLCEQALVPGLHRLAVPAGGHLELR